MKSHQLITVIVNEPGRPLDKGNKFNRLARVLSASDISITGSRTG
jgi:hypothetical protein